MHERHYLLCYDISDPKRLGRIYRRCCKYGTPFQYSVFHLHCSAKVLEDLLDAIEKLIDPSSDDVRAYAISSVKEITTLGEALLPEGIHGQ